jgi:O-antigen ligase
VAVGLLVAPGAVRHRLQSIVHPGPNEPRVVMWRTGVRMIAARPRFGVGPQLVGSRFGEFVPEDIAELPEGYYGHLHNIYVHYAAERGLPAVAFLLWFFAKTLWDHIAALRRAPPSGRDDRRFLLHGAIAATLGVMVVGCFDVTLGDSEVLGIYLAVVALGYRAVEIGRQGVAARPAQGTAGGG